MRLLNKETFLDMSITDALIGLVKSYPDSWRFDPPEFGQHIVTGISIKVSSVFLTWNFVFTEISNPHYQIFFRPIYSSLIS